MPPAGRTKPKPLTVEPGPAPAPPDAAAAPQLEDGDAVPVEQQEQARLEQAVEAAVEFETEVVGDLLLLVFIPLHYLASRGGAPPGAFIPDDVERDTMARPATRMLNRSETLRRFATKADPIALLLHVAQFLHREAGDVEAWRAGQQPATAPPDADLPLTGVSAVDRPGAQAQAERLREQVRRWHPPVPPADPAPA